MIDKYIHYVDTCQENFIRNSSRQDAKNAKAQSGDVKVIIITKKQQRQTGEVPAAAA